MGGEGEPGPLEAAGLDDEQAVRLLREVAGGDGGVTQRGVAAALGVSKREARRCLLAAKRAGIVGETCDDRPSARGRRLFWLTLDRGRGELERLESARRARAAMK